MMLVETYKEVLILTEQREASACELLEKLVLLSEEVKQRINPLVPDELPLQVYPIEQHGWEGYHYLELVGYHLLLLLTSFWSISGSWLRGWMILGMISYLMIFSRQSICTLR